MIISIASGKGGTGKTTIATNLAYLLSLKSNNIALLDCDVEEPNSHIFIKPDFIKRESIKVLIPEVDKKKCTGCGKCGEFCQFKAIVSIKGSVLTFPELCHSCGGCILICPEKALKESYREIGILEEGKRDNLRFVHGKLNVGELASPPVISEVKKQIKPHEISIIDSPPGTSCPVVESVKETDHVLLVTEPTPFGLNDLRLAVDMVKDMEIPFSVVINRSDIGNDDVKRYCKENSIPIHMEIPNDIDIAKAYSKGTMLLEELPHYENAFRNLYESIIEGDRQ